MLTRVVKRKRASARRHRGRSGDAGSLQQPVHVDRRADGRGAAEHRLFGQHQGAARFLLRGLRRATARWSPTRRTCRCISARWTARSRPSSATTRARSAPATSTRSTRPTTAARICPTSPSCTPVFDDRQKNILFWVASRGHHADVGGIAPGSMTPRATTIERGRRLYRQFQAGRARPLSREGAVRRCSPARNIPRAIRAERRRPEGADRRQREGRAGTAQDGRAFRAAESSTPIWGTCRTMPRRACAASSTALHDCEFAYETDQGTVIKVKITVDKKKREATVDFTGTSPQQKTNFNAPEPVTRAAVLYVFRVMVDDDIPMNAGCLRPINIVIPEGSMLTPEYPAAVVAGNVETSQAVTNCLFGALGALAAAQGTMNNLTFGNATYQYYETICSGSPAGPGFDGTDAVHTHMTNTRLTDPEILEFRYPVVLEDFHIRKAPAARASGRRATASAAPSASWKRWNARSCPATAGCRRSGWRAAKTARSARIACAARTARYRKAAGLRRDRDRRRRSRHHPDADRGRIRRSEGARRALNAHGKEKRPDYWVRASLCRRSSFNPSAESRTISSCRRVRGGTSTIRSPRRGRLRRPCRWRCRPFRR